MIGGRSPDLLQPGEGTDVERVEIDFLRFIGERLADRVLPGGNRLDFRPVDQIDIHHWSICFPDQGERLVDLIDGLGAPQGLRFRNEKALHPDAESSDSPFLEKSQLVSPVTVAGDSSKDIGMPEGNSPRCRFRGIEHGLQLGDREEARGASSEGGPRKLGVFSKSDRGALQLEIQCL